MDGSCGPLELDRNLLRSSVYLPLAEYPSRLRKIVEEGRGQGPGRAADAARARSLLLGVDPRLAQQGRQAFGPAMFLLRMSALFRQQLLYVFGALPFLIRALMFLIRA